MRPYDLYLQKSANLYLNARRSVRLSEKLMNQRLRDLESRGFQVFRENKSKSGPFGQNYTSFPYALENGAVGGAIQIPSDDYVKKLRRMGSRRATANNGIDQALSRRRDVHPVLVHHEIDELIAGLNHKRMATLSNDGTTMVAPAGHWRGLIRSNKTNEVSGIIGSHYHPDVLLSEANRVAHQLSPDGAEDMKRLRNNFGENQHFTYPTGTKYIPEGGREWNSQVRVAQSRSRPVLDLDKRVQAQGKMDEAAKGLDNPYAAYVAKRRAGKAFGDQYAKELAAHGDKNVHRFEPATGLTDEFVRSHTDKMMGL